MAESSKKLSIRTSHVKGSKVQKSLAIKKAPSKNKDGSDHKSPTSLFGPHAVTRYLRIPQTGNITGAELTVFLPELLRTPGVLFRFFQNGADAQTLARISTWFRATVKNHHTPATAANAMRHITQPTMRHLVDADWTETRHKAGHYDEAVQVWDHDNLTFSGVKNYCEDNPKDGRHKRLPILNVRFASLAADVVVFPSSNDELDLTRCVKAAVANEELPLMFPRDYDYLTRLLGGPQTVHAGHRDRELFSRWKQVSWVETPSEYQVKVARNLAHYKFTAAQRMATEDYLQHLASIEQPALDESLVDTPVYGHYDPYIPSVNDDPLSLNSLLLGNSMHGSAVRLAQTLPRMRQDEIGVLYRGCSATHGNVPSKSHGLPTSFSNVVRRYLEPDRSLHGLVPPVADETVVMVFSPGAPSSNSFADSNGSRPSFPMNWHLGYRNSSVMPASPILIDPEMLETWDRETTYSVDPEHGMKPLQANPEDYEFNGLDNVEDTFVQDPL